MVHVFERQIGGRTLRIESGKLALQAGGSVTVTYGDTVLLVTATAAPVVATEPLNPVTS